MKRGFFISLEGVDGSGKTTQVPLLTQRLVKMGLSVVAIREPGGTDISEKIRQLLLDAANDRMSFRTEALLYAASRAQLVDEVIAPALAEGKVVIADRFADSTIAYQGYARGLEVGFLQQLNLLSTGGLEPDVTLTLMVRPEVALSRRKGLSRDRLEKEGLAFHQRVGEGYLALAQQHPHRIFLIDGEKDPETVSNQIWSRVQAELARRGMIDG